MKNTKFTCVILITLLSINCLFGCGSQKQKPDFSSIKSVCELSTLKCYYHNVATYEKNAHGLLKVFGSGYKKIWIEYSGKPRMVHIHSAGSSSQWSYIHFPYKPDSGLH